MKLKNIFFPAIIFIIIGLSACKKEYYEETGKHDPKYNGTIWQYLQGRKDLFDTLTKVVEYAGMKDILDKESVTFFAPPDMSIVKAMKELNEYLVSRGQDTVTSYKQVDPSVWKDFLGMYIIKDKYVLKDFPQLDTINLETFGGQGYTSYSGRVMNIGVLYNDTKTVNSNGDIQIIKYSGYRQLYLNYVENYSSSNNLFSMTTGPVATSDIQPTNGVLHVLQFSRHIFGFQRLDFVRAAVDKGIKPLN
ncbi:fasciclin domain-containing protein [Sphingobacterium spiritivorum]|nr:fasciclin domain-containing protein [Sphingobacterium spiritivorum]WQD34448.1 fasciclin domain-containing protein [Sphingobacterium spiritivorum]SUI97427.1 Fasciclin domain [Sphingobacterium spiritivorum]